ncbi:hypothetical protein [Companilactobacillus kimchii]|uniref:Uncharacterized protein n=2 Tax=Companilactobacillus kimchii TaxID=2801452 RepID=A0ABR5NRA0_9LACO|nr:hypothetical protein [Companilactobacillus kimchii]GEO47982.1 hypothetical protein LKI01_19810 [Companilactobacillus paralimentarius]KAE9557298.1 hypothetical protein ATN91_03915 [Companilactobacillus kimchii]KAE9559239.1 hypothetical protein ATN91_11345 [Companilactobacillus kimchii]KRK50510.1 hypothetical protein FC97_GL001433 [Companilactobacillus kimchii DSM 13961 = JCM 10707]OWF33756.1 hypothetical protein LKACC12383_00896 [Companilactobacillus kimchii]
MKEKYIELISVKQDYLFNGPKKYVDDIKKMLNDEVLSKVKVEEKESDNSAQFNLGVLGNNDGKHLFINVAFVYSYKRNYRSDPNYYSILGKFESLMESEEDIKNIDDFNVFVNENLFTLVKPIMNSISKTISEITADTLDYPNQLDIYNVFKRKYEKKSENKN